jgi:hypothetical protein
MQGRGGREGGREGGADAAPAECEIRIEAKKAVGAPGEPQLSKK